MKNRAMQADEEMYTAKYGLDALQDTQQRIEFGEWLCSKKNQVFQFKGILENVSRSSTPMSLHSWNYVFG